MRKTFLTGCVAALGLGLAQSALAQNGAGYTYLEADFVATELDGNVFGGDIDGDGLGLQGAFAITPRLHAYGEYSRQEFDFGIDLDTFELGIGVNHPIASNVDLIGRVGFASMDAEVVDDTGFALQAGVRGLVAGNVQLEGLVHHVDLDDFGDSTSIRLNGRYFFTPNLAVGAGVELEDDSTIWMAGVRYSFGR